MAILTFDFRNSYRGVTHTQTYYEGLAPQLFTVGDGYNNHAIAHYVGTATLHHTDGTTETIDDRDAFHPEKATAKGLNISAAAVLAHAPTSNYYELWQHLPNDPGGMALRISARVPPPPNWSDYVKTDYNGNTVSSSGYGADLQKYVAALTQWEFGEGWETSNGMPIPRRNATLRDGTHTLGTIHASDGIDPNLFLAINDVQTIVTGSQHKDSVHGGKLDDRLSGIGGNDFINGFEGDDYLDGGSDNDQLYGSGGDDRLRGGTGEDTLTGQRGNDRVEGDDDNDTLFGASGKDRLQGGDGNDVVHGDEDDDRLEGNDGEDRLTGGAENDRLLGGNDADRLYGDAGDDELDGGIGNDRLSGDEGLDALRGRSGNDELVGGKGADDLVGDAGRDQFVFTDHNFVDNIQDFRHGADKIVLLKIVFDAIDAMSADAFHVGAHAADDEDRVIYWHHVLYYDADGARGGSTQEAFAKVVNGASLTASDFLLV